MGAALQTSPGSTDADKVAVLDAVMAHRLLWFNGADTGVFVACDAFKAVGEPEDFPAGLTWADRILEQVPTPCEEGRDYPPFPRIHVREITITDSVATATLRVVNHNGAYVEDIRLDARRAGFFGVKRSELHSSAYR